MAEREIVTDGMICLQGNGTMIEHSNRVNFIKHGYVVFVTVLWRINFIYIEFACLCGRLIGKTEILFIKIIIIKMQKGRLQNI